METLSPNIAIHIPLYGSRLLHGQGGIWKGDVMVADIEELEEVDAEGSTQRKR